MNVLPLRKTPLIVIRVVVMPIEKSRVATVPRWRVNRAKFLLYANGIKTGKGFIEALEALQDEKTVIRCVDCFVPEGHEVLKQFLLFLSPDSGYPGLRRLRFGDVAGTETAISHMVDIADTIETGHLTPAHKRAFTRLLGNAVLAIAEAAAHPQH